MTTDTTAAISLEPAAPRVQQQFEDAASVIGSSEMWRRFAAREERRNPTLAAEYRQLADSVERWLSAQTWGV
mgnify:CR=1 FL=1